MTAVADTLDEALHEAGIALGFAFEDWPGDPRQPRSLDDLRNDPHYTADAVGRRSVDRQSFDDRSNKRQERLEGRSTSKTAELARAAFLMY